MAENGDCCVRPGFGNEAAASLKRCEDITCAKQQSGSAGSRSRGVELGQQAEPLSCASLSAQCCCGLSEQLGARRPHLYSLGGGGGGGRGDLHSVWGSCSGGVAVPGPEFFM